MTRKNPKMRPRINPPEIIDLDDPAYLAKCMKALEPSLDGLIDLAVEAGWSREKAMAAIMLSTGCLMERDGLHLGWLANAEESEVPPLRRLN